MINVQRLEMELIHMPHTSDNDKKHAIITQNAQKNEQEQKIFSKVNVHTLKDRSPLIPSYINNYVDVLTF